jgi:hypothetical protein
MTTTKTLNERSLRRLARSRGYELRKSHRRDPDAPDYGLYNLFDPETGGCAMSHGVISPFAWTLEDVADYLRGEEHRR